MHYYIGSGKYLVSYEDDSISFPNGEKCKYSHGKCTSPNYGNIFWIVEAPKCSDGNKILVYAGTGEYVVDRDNQDEFVQVNHDGYDFQILLRRKRVTVCDYSSYTTEHPNLFVTVIDEASPDFPIKSRGDIKELSLMNYLNSKLVYTMRHT